MPFVASALSVSWDRYIVGAERPLFPTDNIHVGASATSTNATFEVDGSAAIASSTTGCVQAGTGGVLYFTGTACGSGGGSSFGQSWELNGAGLLAPTTTVSIAVSGTATSTYAGPVSIKGYTIASTSTVCLKGEDCTYQTTPSNFDSTMNTVETSLNAIGGGNIIVKKGTYTPTGQINLKSNVNVLCEAGTLIKFSVTDVGPSQRAGMQASSTDNASVQNCKMDGSGQLNTVFNGDIMLEIASSSNIKILNNTFQNSNGFAMFLDPTPTLNTGTTTNIIISNNVMSCNGLQDCIGGGPHEDNGQSAVRDIIVSNNIITQTNRGATMDTNCVDIVRMFNTTIDNNICYGSFQLGFERVPNSYSKVTNNIINAPYGTVLKSGEIIVNTGTQVTSNATNTTQSILLSGNIISNGGILISGQSTNLTTGLVISGNTIQSSPAAYQTSLSAKYGIEIDFMKDSIITGNAITAPSGSTATGVFFNDSSSINNIISINTIKNFSTGLNMGSASGNKDIFNTYINDMTNASGGSNSINMDASGNVGIGTTSPTSLFDVEKNTNASITSTLRNYSNGTGAVSSVSAVNDTGTQASLQSFGSGNISTYTYYTNTFLQNNWDRLRASTAATGLIIGTGGTAPIIFGIGDSEVMRLSSTSAGFLGLGTSTPWGLLSVNPNALGSGVPEFVVGSSTKTHFMLTGDGSAYFGTSTQISGFSAGGLFTSGPFVSTGSNVIPTTASGQNVSNLLNNFNNSNGLLIKKVSTGTGDYLDIEDASANQKFIVKSSGNTGIGTSSPTAIFSVDNASSTAGTLQGTPFGRLLGMVIAGTEYMIESFDYYGHPYTSGPTPSVSGGTSSMNTPSNDQNGSISVVGTALTSVTMTFAKPWLSAPSCQESDNVLAVGSDITSISSTQVVFGFGTGGVASATIWYKCTGSR